MSWNGKTVRVGCGALIVNDSGEVLLLRRGPKARNEIGYWNQPGGAVEFGEAISDAIIREIKEELDIEIELLEYLCYTDQILHDERQYWVAISYLAKIKQGEPRLVEPGKHDEYGWFKIEEIPEKLAGTTRDSVQSYKIKVDQKSV